MKIKALFNVAKVLEDKQGHQEAIDTYLQVLDLDPNDHKCMVNIAILKERMGQRDAALKHLEQAIVLKGTDRKILTNLGIIKRKDSQFQESHTLLSKALELFHSDVLSSDEEDGNGERKNGKDILYVNKLIAQKESGNLVGEDLIKHIDEAVDVIKRHKNSTGRVPLAHLCEEIKHLK